MNFLHGGHQDAEKYNKIMSLCFKTIFVCSLLSTDVNSSSPNICTIGVMVEDDLRLVSFFVDILIQSSIHIIDQTMKETQRFRRSLVVILLDMVFLFLIDT